MICFGWVDLLKAYRHVEFPQRHLPIEVRSKTVSGIPLLDIGLKVAIGIGDVLQVNSCETAPVKMRLDIQFYLVEGERCFTAVVIHHSGSGHETGEGDIGAGFRIYVSFFVSPNLCFQLCQPRLHRRQTVIHCGQGLARQVDALPVGFIRTGVGDFRFRPTFCDNHTAVRRLIVFRSFCAAEFCLGTLEIVSYLLVARRQDHSF